MRITRSGFIGSIKPSFLICHQNRLVTVLCAFKPRSDPGDNHVGCCSLSCSLETKGRWEGGYRFSMMQISVTQFMCNCLCAVKNAVLGHRQYRNTVPDKSRSETISETPLACLCSRPNSIRHICASRHFFLANSVADTIVDIISPLMFSLNPGWPSRIGACEYISGSRYEGLWLDSKKHGEGVLTFPNGDLQAGTWHRDEYVEPATATGSVSETSAPSLTHGVC